MKVKDTPKLTRKELKKFLKVLAYKEAFERNKFFCSSPIYAATSALTFLFKRTHFNLFNISTGKPFNNFSQQELQTLKQAALHVLEITEQDIEEHTEKMQG